MVMHRCWFIARVAGEEGLGRIPYRAGSIPHRGLIRDADDRIEVIQPKGCSPFEAMAAALMLAVEPSLEQKAGLDAVAKVIYLAMQQTTGRPCIVLMDEELLTIYNAGVSGWHFYGRKLGGLHDEAN